MSKPPQELPTTKEVDTLIAHEMASLSKKDREDALGDLHGVERSPIEDKAFIDKCLVEIEASLTRMKTKTKTKTKSETKTDSRIDVYSLAESMSKEYVENRAFRLKFLVAEEFKPEDAAERLVRFLELKRNLFGEEKLVQEITLEDFSKEDMRSLETGHVQVLPIHDMCGRSIVFGARSLRQNATNRQSLRRCMYYAFMKAAETSASPRNSVVVVYYCVDAILCDKPNTIDIKMSLPVRLASIHYCYNDETQVRIIQEGLKDSSTAHRMRYRPHFGDRQECFATLQSYGIPREAIPVTNDGDFPIEQHRAWLAKQKQQLNDSTDDTPKRSDENKPRIVPRTNDVLFGRGKAIMDNPGNVKLRTIIRANQEKYNKASKFEKMCVTEMIVRLILKSGRFLRLNGSVWEEVSVAAAKEKVAHCFRNNRR